MTSITVFYLTSVVFSALVTIPLSVIFYRKNPTIAINKPALATIYLTVLVPPMNLVMVVFIFWILFTEKKKKYKDSLAYQKNPQLSSLDSLREIKATFLKNTDSYPNKSQLAGYILNIQQVIDYLETNYEKPGISYVLTNYEITFANILAILHESSNIEKDMVNQFIGESYDVLLEFFDDIHSFKTKKESIEKESIEAIRARFSQELKQERNIHRERKNNVFSKSLN